MLFAGDVPIECMTRYELMSCHSMQKAHDASKHSKGRGRAAWEVLGLREQRGPDRHAEGMAQHERQAVAAIGSANKDNLVRAELDGCAATATTEFCLTAEQEVELGRRRKREQLRHGPAHRAVRIRAREGRNGAM